ncbi:MAG: pentapeptide repeat-containing protein [Cryobacterium sp.]|nr:pentapeptide repeat-containing protein [Oligoflexia bacterium]
MKSFAVVLFAILSIQATAFARDLGFRYNALRNECRNSAGKLGLNPDFIGVCGDLTSTRLTTLNLFESHLMGADLSPITRNPQDDIAFDYSDFRGVKAIRGEFINGSYKGVNFQKADFSDAAFLVRGQARPISFNDADFRNSRFLGATFVLADFMGADLRFADFRSIDCKNCNWKGAIYNSKSRLPFSFETADRMGMISAEMDPPPTSEDRFEPPFPGRLRLDFDLGACASESECANLYREDASIHLLSPGGGESFWILTAVDNLKRTSWLDDQNGRIWSDEFPNTVMPARAVGAYCEKESSLVPTPQDYSRAHLQGLAQVLPSLRRSRNVFWTSESTDPTYREHYYAYRSDTGTMQVFWHEDPLRVLCVRVQRNFRRRNHPTFYRPHRMRRSMRLR